MKTISSIKGDKMAIRSKRLELPEAPLLLRNLGGMCCWLSPQLRCVHDPERRPGERLLIYAAQTRGVFQKTPNRHERLKPGVLGVLPQGSIRHS